MGFLDSLFGGSSTKDDKQKSLRDIGGVRRRNEADLSAFGTQQRLDIGRNVGEQNAQAQQFVRNQGLAGSTIAPTLMA